MYKIIIIVSFLCITVGNAQIVNIPDANFKNALVNHNPVIDVNGDGEIQVSEANGFSDELNVFNKSINNLIGIEEFINISGLDCAFNNIVNIDLSNNISLEFLSCGNNNLLNLDLTNNSTLQTLWCENNSLTSLLLDTSIEREMETIICSNNQLTILDVSNITFTFEDLHCDNNNFINLDFSQTKGIDFYQCQNNNDLIYINLKNGENSNIDFFSNFENLPNLESICIDDISNVDFINFILTEVGHPLIFKDTCTLNILENKLLNFVIYPTPTRKILNIKSKTEITKIEIYSKLGQLILKNTTENKINISNLTKGFYFIKVEDVNGNFGTKNIVKQ